MSRPTTITPKWSLTKLLVPIATVFFLMSVSIATAQTVSVTPTGYITAPLGGTVQFAATVTGSSNQAVTWSLPGQKKNSTALGTISSNGLYSAPTAPPPGGVEILATSLADPNATAAQFVYILGVGPKISTVTPNPIASGTSTVTITGSGFQAYAVVDYSYNGSPVQTSPLTLSSSVITASAYFPAGAANATFTVTNPGTSPSNAVIVPINGGTKTYALTVTSGSGSGSYAAGKVVPIVANAPPAGKSFLNWTGASVANPNAASTTVTMTAANAAVTANYSTSNASYTLTVNNGSGSGSYAPGTVVNISANAPPAGEVFQDWTGAAVTAATSASTTLTMPAAATSVTANFQAAAQVPYPVSAHPRLWLTPADLPRLQSWATASNPVYAKGMVPLLATAVSAYETSFFPGGVPNPNYPDLGDTQGYTGSLTEEVGFVLAFNSLIDPVPANRIKYAQYARNLIMYAMNQAVLGPLANTPFRDPEFPIYNRGDFAGDQWSLIVDWIYNATDANNQPILSSADKLTIRNVFMIWANECLNASTTGGDHPVPIGTTNDFSLINGGSAPYRMASNNYYLGHARNLTMMALAIDPADDPAVNAAVSPATLGNSLRSYILDANGAWLYQTYAMMADPAQVASDYNLPGNGSGFGLASGGLPPEGMLYGESFAYVLGQLLALQTAGFNNPALSGPQIKLIGAPVWDRYVTAMTSSITPTAVVSPNAAYLGPIYYLALFGDVLQSYVTPNQMQPFALLSLLEQEQGQTTHLNAAKWFATNAVQGSLLYNVSTPWTWGTVQSILYYMLLDPSAPAATDPRPTQPLNYFDAETGRTLARSDWSSNPTCFDYRASWTSINHQQGDAGEFEFFRDGEWLTKEMSNYDNNLVGFTPYYLNTLGLKNWCANGTPNLSWDETGIWANGGQWMWGANAGDPTTINSSGVGYTYASSNLTNLYNRPDIWSPASGATDISLATRSVVWLDRDYVVTYDRATSVHSGLFKTFNLSLANPPAIKGNVVTETMADAQQLFIQTLLPQNAQLTARYAAGDLNPHANLDPMFYVLTVQDPTLPADTRFLHVLQGSDASGAVVPATYVVSAAGTIFDGATFGSYAVFFPHAAGGSVATTSFNVPSTVTSFVVTGLTLGASYGLTSLTTSNGKTVTLTPGGTGHVADSAGLLRVSI